MIQPYSILSYALVGVYATMFFRVFFGDLSHSLREKSEPGKGEYSSKNITMLVGTFLSLGIFLARNLSMLDQGIFDVEQALSYPEVVLQVGTATPKALSALVNNTRSKE